MGPHPRGRKRKQSPLEEKEPRCSVCTNGEPNYKCPRCRSLYCSIACCRKHKEEFCQVLLSEKAQLIVKPQVTQKAPRCSHYMPISTLENLESEWLPERSPGDLDGIDARWKLSEETKEGLDASAWLRNELSDPGLKALIARIVHTPFESVGGKSVVSKREAALEDLRKEYPPFSAFIDKVMVLGGVLERTVDAIPIETWLETTAIPRNLLLAELPNGRPNFHQASAKGDDSTHANATDESLGSGADERDKPNV